MKKAVLILLLLSNGLFAGAGYIGKVYYVRGNAYITQIQSKKQKRLVKGIRLRAGSVIITQKKSKVYIELEDGIKLYVPPKSRFTILDEKRLKMYQKSQKTIQKFFTLAGTKASNSSIIKKPTIIEKIKNLLQNQKNLEAIKLMEQSKIKITDAQMLYGTALAYLKLGDNQKAISYFKAIIKQGIFEYKRLSEFGLFIAYLRTGEREKAKAIFLNTRRRVYFYKAMTKLMDEKS